MRLRLILYSLYSFSLGSFWANDYLEFDSFALLKRFVTILLNGRIVHEDIGPAWLLDESVALGIAEPFDLAL